MSSPEKASGFSGLGLSAASLQALERAGYETPTPIQARAIPPALEGKDVIGCAATGTGKSAAFVLPMVERLHGKQGTVGLILAPTRELALQIAEHVHAFGHGRRVSSATIIGGVPMRAQQDALRAKPAIVIATPGRLVDHLQQGTADLTGIEILVLDEADRMLDMGFRPQLTRILQKLPRTRQTLLFSATIGGEVSDFARQSGLRAPVRIEIARSGTTAARAKQGVFLVSQNEKTALLLTLLQSDSSSTLVFTRTKRRADRVAKAVQRAGHSVARIHADRSQSQRKAALEGFRRGQFRVLIATDIAARGIDVEDIGHVVNFDLPHVAEDYVHRIGRTARASASGRASSFVSPEERELLTAIERLTRQTVTRVEIDRTSEVFQREVARSAAAQANPGPPQREHHKSSRPAGQQPGRHARTHRRKSTSAGQGDSAPRREPRHR